MKIDRKTWEPQGQNGLRAARRKPCPYCGVTMDAGITRPTRDHCVPRSRGGTLRDGNCVIVCERCNGDKNDMTITEFHAYLHQAKDFRSKRVGKFIDRLQVQFPQVWELSCAAFRHSRPAASSSNG